MPSQIVPVHALRAERKGCRDLPAAADAAGGEHRDVGAGDIDHLRHEHHGGDLPPVWPPASCPCATMMSTPTARCAFVLGLSAQRADEDAAAVQSTSSFGGAPRALTTSLTCGWRSATSISLRAPSGVVLRPR